MKRQPLNLQNGSPPSPPPVPLTADDDSPMLPDPPSTASDESSSHSGSAPAPPAPDPASRQGSPPLLTSTLYLVATPIGNLEDITLRALRVLRECDLVAAEDTRRTGQLLRHFGISKPLLSYFQFNEARRSEQILHRLGSGQKIALVSDAGSPGISDPGQRVVAAAIAAGFRVEAVPGPCALVPALTASGLPTDEFHFVGFLPHKSGQRRNRLESLRPVPGTLLFYESPYRILKLLQELQDIYPDSQVVLARELTKKFEEYLRG
ncbi:MAG: 16S rRNA (cytidine(1402)-2'-O)-methyltransferase, partial [Verrucomicrobiota bacterium]